MRWNLLVLLLLLSVVTASAQPVICTDQLTLENASRLTELAIAGHSQVFDTAFSPDGRILALGTKAGVWFYSVADLSAVPQLLKTGPGETWNVSYDISGDYLFTENVYPDVGGGFVTVWRLTGSALPAKAVRDWAGRKVERLVADGRLILRDDRSLADTSSKTIYTLTLAFDKDFAQNNYANIAIDPERRMVAVPNWYEYMYSGDILRVFDLDTSELLARIRRNDHDSVTGVLQLEFHPHYGLIALTSDYTTSRVILWSIEVLRGGKRLTPKDGRTLWESTTRTPQTFTLAEHGTKLLLDFSRYVDKPRFLVIDLTRRGGSTSEFDAGYLAIHPVSGHVITFDRAEGGLLLIRDWSASRDIATLDGFDTIPRAEVIPVITAAVIENPPTAPTFETETPFWWTTRLSRQFGDLGIASDYYGNIAVWDTHTGAILAYRQALPWGVTGIDMSVDGRRLWLTVSDGTIRTWGIPAADCYK